MAREEPTRARADVRASSRFVLPESGEVERDGDDEDATRASNHQSGQGHAASTVRRLLGYLGKTSPSHPRQGLASAVVTGRVYLIDKLKISEVGGKREYRIYRNSIGDRKKIWTKFREKTLILCRNKHRFFFKPYSLKNYT